MNRLLPVLLLLWPVLVSSGQYVVNDPILREANPASLTLDYSMPGEFSVDWQFSMDGGERWRPMVDRVGRESTVPAGNEYYDAATRLTFKENLPRGLSLRVKFTFADESTFLTDTYTIPHVYEFPAEKRELVLKDYPGSNSVTIEADSGLLAEVRFVPSGSPQSLYSLVTYEREGTGWSPGVLNEFPGTKLSTNPRSRTFLLHNRQLFVCAGIYSGTDGTVQVYDWGGSDTGWILRQELTEPEMDGPARYAVSVSVSEERLFVSSSGPDALTGVGWVYLYEPNPDGDWELVTRLKPDSSITWTNASRLPFSFGDTIVTQGTYREGQDNIFYFRKQQDGTWLFEESEELNSEFVFKVGNLLVRAFYNFYGADVEDVYYNSIQLVVTDPGLGPLGEPVSVSYLDYGMFSAEALEDWIVFHLEPSPANMLPPDMAVAISPLYEGSIFPDPAVLLPANRELYTTIAGQVSSDGSLVYATANLLDGTKVVNSFDLDQVPHPRYMQVPFAKWTVVGALKPGSLRFPIYYREDAEGDMPTEIFYKTDADEWKQLDESEVTRTVVDPDPDGDGKTVIIEAEVPMQVDGKDVLYRFGEERTVP